MDKQEGKTLKEIREIIVVEGRDDEAAVKASVRADTIATHGFGISQLTWGLIEKANKQRGIIIFTDPDHAGEDIRRRIKARFPYAKEAFLSREEARNGIDIGIENASPASIERALEKAQCTFEQSYGLFSKEDMAKYGLEGEGGSGAKREALGKALGIGYGNSKGFLKKLNQYQVSIENFEEALANICLEKKDKEDSKG